MLTDTDMSCRDRLEVRTLRCGRNNPGSNPGHGIIFNTFRLVYSGSKTASECMLSSALVGHACNV